MEMVQRDLLTYADPFKKKLQTKHELIKFDRERERERFWKKRNQKVPKMALKL